MGEKSARARAGRLGKAGIESTEAGGEKESKEGRTGVGEKRAGKMGWGWMSV